MEHEAIKARLLATGNALFAAPSELVRFTGIDEADGLLNDLELTPHAYVIACIMDRQVKAERAWVIPHLLKLKLGDFSFSTLQHLTRDDFKRLMAGPPPLHMYHSMMAENIFEAVNVIATRYSGDASLIWRNRPSSAEVVYRFFQFRGMGQKIATMAANILARDFKVPFADYYSIDISVDVHVKRVFERLGLVESDATPEEIIYRARAMSPEYPGLFDLSIWQLGREYCFPQNPRCSECHMQQDCPTGQ
jgi:endonuclease III